MGEATSGCIPAVKSWEPSIAVRAGHPLRQPISHSAVGLQGPFQLLIFLLMFILTCTLQVSQASSPPVPSLGEVCPQRPLCRAVGVAFLVGSRAGVSLASMSPASLWDPGKEDPGARLPMLAEHRPLARHLHRLSSQARTLPAAEGPPPSFCR